MYWVLFCFVPGTLAAPCLTCFGFQPGCTFETDGKCPMADIPVANLAITAKAGVGGALAMAHNCWFVGFRLQRVPSVTASAGTPRAAAPTDDCNIYIIDKE